MEIKEIKELMEVLEQSSIAKLKFETDDYKLELEKEQKEMPIVVTQAVNPVATQVVPLVASDGASLVEAPVSSVVNEVETKSTAQVFAPLVGVFYQASTPEAEPFVKVGQQVKEGDTLCILEAMKVLNEIKAPSAGTVVAIHVDNGDVVEFNQVLMEIGG